MPRVHSKTKSNRGRERKCGRCGKAIQPGTTYYTWEFRYGGAQFRCAEHYPRQSELTQSKMSAVYAALESAEDAVSAATTIQDVTDAVQGAASEIEDVASEYRDAAEAMGDAGYEHEEKADALEQFAQDLESWEPTVEAPDSVEERAAAALRAEGFSEDDEAEWASVFQARVERLAEDGDDADDEALEAAKEEANQALQELPL